MTFKWKLYIHLLSALISTIRFFVTHQMPTRSESKHKRIKTIKFDTLTCWQFLWTSPLCFHWHKTEIFSLWVSMLFLCIFSFDINLVKCFSHHTLRHLGTIFSGLRKRAPSWFHTECTKMRRRIKIHANKTLVTDSFNPVRFYPRLTWKKNKLN